MRGGPHEAMIEGVEVEIGEKLAGEIADGQASGSLQGGEQGVAGEGVESGAKAGAIGEDAVEEPEGAGAGDAFGELAPQVGEIEIGRAHV